jgi:plasmid maintenance system antidote protein VapI
VIAQVVVGRVAPRCWAIPPGEMLLEEFLKPPGLGQVEAARRLGMSLTA